MVLHLYYNSNTLNKSKRGKKGDNKSIRFEPEKFEFICLEEKLETPQQVVDFLVDKYWWGKKIGGNPVVERNTPKIVEAQKDEVSAAPDPNDKPAYLKWLKAQKTNGS